MLEHFEHDAPRWQIDPFQCGQQGGGEIRIGERARMHVQEQPLALRAEYLEILQMQRLGQLVDLQHIAEARGLAEYVERRHGPVERVVRTQQPFVTDRPHMRQAENRLKHAAQREFAMLHRKTFEPRRHLDTEAMWRAGRPFLLRNRHASPLTREPGRSERGSEQPRRRSLKCASSIYLKQAPCAR